MLDFAKAIHKSQAGSRQRDGKTPVRREDRPRGGSAITEFESRREKTTKAPPLLI
jgi:hypothetical protein